MGILTGTVKDAGQVGVESAHAILVDLIAQVKAALPAGISNDVLVAVDQLGVDAGERITGITDALFDRIEKNAPGTAGSVSQAVLDVAAKYKLTVTIELEKK